MSIKYETVQVPARPAHQIDREVAYVCDFCGKETRMDGGNVDGAQLKRITRETFPGTGSLTEDIVDCCPTCWDSVVLPLLHARNIVPRTLSTDW